MKEQLVLTDNIQLQKLKAVELDLLTQFIAICDKLRLRYFLVGGSALGAVRHKGFIPWDDDIDVGMPRTDYEVFLQKAEQYLDDRYFLQSYRNEREYPASFAKLRNNNTTFVETAIKELHINHGVYIDIFPLDGYPSGTLKQCIFQIRKDLLSRKISTAYAVETRRQSSIKGRFLTIFVQLLYSIISVPQAVEKLDKLYSAYDYDNSNIVANLCGAWGKREIMPKEYFGHGCNAIFEGIDVIIPEKYDCYLTCLYGDYMKLPPLEKQKAHHYADIIDLSSSYKKYLRGG